MKIQNVHLLLLPSAFSVLAKRYFAIVFLTSKDKSQSKKWIEKDTLQANLGIPILLSSREKRPKVDKVTFGAKNQTENEEEQIHEQEPACQASPSPPRKKSKEKENDIYEQICKYFLK